MEKMDKLLRELAEQLGTTVEYLWEVLLKQAVVEQRLCEIWMNIGLFLFCGIAAIIFMSWGVGLKRRWDGDGLFALFTIGLIFTLIGVLIYYSNYADYLTVTLNPEYWALDQVLDKIK
jgi:hypothetical protein